MNFTAILPEEVTDIIFEHLSFEDRARGCVVNRTWNRLSKHQFLGPSLELQPKQVISSN